MNGLNKLARRAVLLLIGAAMLAACSAVDISSKGKALPANERWAMLPLLNRTETPLAGLRAESILQPLLHQRGLDQLDVYPTELSKDTMLATDERAMLDQAMQWARDQHIRYAVGGSVDEWRYKVGVDGEPAVGVSLMVWDLETGRVVWSAVGGKSGFSREAVSAVAQKLLRQLTDGLPLTKAGASAS
ncbi:hypothetical protein [Andreprevotia chitinilytica]|uniref:hypothetical protein n=1 Tax=Andreprevotia chitinilytica TaxID=396808 RepID=UPI00054E7C4C|nr:hypothetical protein [Andreprevotia chitinilytica]